MADKKLNEVTKVTDMAYVPVIMADGSVGQIAKSDLASVVAGVINPMKWLGQTEDLDSITKSGFGYFTGTPNGFFTNVQHPTESGYKIQTRSNDNGTVLEYRTKNGFSWSAWSRIDNFGYNSLAELSAGVEGNIKGRGFFLAFKGGLGANDDLNDLTDNGVYYNLNNVGNSPIGANYAFFVNISNMEGRNVQFIFDYQTFTIYMRGRGASGWTTWRSVNLT